MNKKYFSLPIIILFSIFCSISSHATFTLSGTTITQTGTDLDLSGLESISGVDYFETTNEVDTYRMVTIPPNYVLNIEGDLTIDANTDMLVIEHTATNFLFMNINQNGILRIKDTSTNGIETGSYQKTALMILARTDNHWNTGQGMNIYGTLQMDGGTLYSNSHINVMSDTSTFEVLSESVIRLGVANNGYNNMLRFAGSRADVSVDGLILLESANGFETADILQLDNYAPQFNKEGIMVYGGANSGKITLYSFNPYGNEKDFAFIASGSFYTVYGYPNKVPTASVHFDHGSASGGGWVEIRKVLKLNVLDSQDSTVENAKLYIKDVNNGFRYNKLVDYTQDIEYINSSNSSGQLEVDVLLANVQVAGGEIVGSNSAPRDVDYRVKANDGSEYTMDGVVFSYGHQIKQLNNIELGGLDPINEITEKLLDDALIDEQDVSVVQLYSQIDTSQKFYDYAKFYLLENYKGESETLVTRVDDTLNANSYDIIIDNNAQDVFNIVGNTITIRASTFVGSIETSGIVTLQNGAIVDGVIKDANFVEGMISLTFKNIDADSYIYAKYESNDSIIVNTKINDTGNYYYTIEENESIYYAIADFATEIESGVRQYDSSDILIEAENKELEGITKTQSEVEALTEFNDLDELYAYLSYYKSLSQGFFEPEIEEVFVIKAGDLLVFKPQNIIFSSSTPDLVNYNAASDTLTLKGGLLISQTPSFINVYSTGNISYENVLTNFTDIGGATFNTLAQVNVTLFNLPSSSLAQAKCLVEDITYSTSTIYAVNSSGNIKFNLTPPVELNIFCDALGYERRVEENVLISGVANVGLDMSLEILKDINNNNLYGFADTLQKARVSLDLDNDRLYLNSGISILTYQDIVDKIEEELNEDYNLNHILKFDLNRDRIGITNSVFKITPSNSVSEDVEIDFLAYDSETLDYNSPFITNANGYRIIYPDNTRLVDREYNRNYTLILDEFRVFNDALNSEEIEQLFKDEFRIRSVTVDDFTINNSKGEIEIDITLPYVISGEEIEYSIYYNER